jgi:hypothetical protein
MANDKWLDYHSVSPPGLIEAIELVLADLLVYTFHIGCPKEIGNLLTSHLRLVLPIIFLPIIVNLLPPILHVPTHVLEHVPHLFPTEEAVLVCIVLIEDFVQHFPQLLFCQWFFFLLGVVSVVAVAHLIESVSIVLVIILWVSMVMVASLGDLVIALRLRLTRAHSHFHSKQLCI